MKKHEVQIFIVMLIFTLVSQSLGSISVTTALLVIICITLIQILISISRLIK